MLHVCLIPSNGDNHMLFVFTLNDDDGKIITTFHPFNSSLNMFNESCTVAR